MRISRAPTWTVIAALASAAGIAQAPNQTSVPATASSGPPPAAYSSSLLPSETVQLAGSTPASHPGPITVLENTPIRVMTDAPMSTRQTRQGAQLLFTLSEDVVVDQVLVIPRGATVHGIVVESKEPGTLTGGPELTLQLSSLDLGKKSYPLYTYLFRVKGTSKTRPTETKINGGAIIGAIVGAAFSGSAKGQTTPVGKLAGMGTGAALGAGVGAMVSAATPGPILSIPAESQMEFSLSSPIAVEPLSPAQAAHLSQGLHHGGPVLYVRGDTP